MSSQGPKPASVTAAVRALLGTRYRHQGRRAGVGLDCVGLLWNAASSLGIVLEDYRGYTPRGAPEHFERLMDAQLDRVRIDTSAVGEGQWWSIRIRMQPRHLVYFTGRSLIHATADAGRVCEQSLDYDMIAEHGAAWRLRWQP